MGPKREVKRHKVSQTAETLATDQYKGNLDPHSEEKKEEKKYLKKT